MVPARQSVLLLVPLAALAVGALQTMNALVADAEIELAVGADQDAVNAVIVVEAAEAGEQFLRRTVGLAVAVLVLEDQNVRRLADVDLVDRARPVAVRFGGHGDAQRRQQLRRLIKRDRLVGLAGALAVFEDDDAIAFGAIEFSCPAACCDS